MEYAKEKFIEHSDNILSNILYEKMFVIDEPSFENYKVLVVIKREPLGNERCYVIYKDTKGYTCCEKYDLSYSNSYEELAEHFLKKTMYKFLCRILENGVVMEHLWSTVYPLLEAKSNYADWNHLEKHDLKESDYVL